IALGLGAWIYLRQEHTVDVRTVSPVYEDIVATVSSTGVVTPAREFQARANFSGIVEKIYVHVGQKVRAGQLLLYLKDQYATSRVDAARAALADAELASARRKRTARRSISSATTAILRVPVWIATTP